MKLKLLSVLCIIFGLTAQSQGVTDDGILNQQVKTASEFYYNTLGPQADIYYGRDYTPYLFKMEGTPFFMVNELQDGYRVVLTLYLFEGYDHEEISHILKISENTSRSQYMRAKRKLNSLLETKGVVR